MSESESIGASKTTPATQLTSLRFSWMGGLLQKTQVKYVTVSLTLVDPDGIVLSTRGWGDGPVDCPCVLVEHLLRVEPHSRFARAVTLHLTSGTNKNGVWSGRFALGAADAGFWRPIMMAAATSSSIGRTFPLTTHNSPMCRPPGTR